MSVKTGHTNFPEDALIHQENNGSIYEIITVAEIEWIGVKTNNKVQTNCNRTITTFVLR